MPTRRFTPADVRIQATDRIATEATQNLEPRSQADLVGNDRMHALRHYLPLPGRILLGLLFVISGIFKIPGWEPTLGFMVSKGLPLAALFLLGAIVLEIVGGLALMVGYQARLAAAALAVFSLVTALIFHNFWTFTGLEQQAPQILGRRRVHVHHPDQVVEGVRDKEEVAIHLNC